MAERMENGNRRGQRRGRGGRDPVGGLPANKLTIHALQSSDATCESSWTRQSSKSSFCSQQTSSAAVEAPAPPVLPPLLSGPPLRVFVLPPPLVLPPVLPPELPPLVLPPELPPSVLPPELSPLVLPPELSPPLDDPPLSVTGGDEQEKEHSTIHSSQVVTSSSQLPHWGQFSSPVHVSSSISVHASGGSFQ